MRAFSRVCGDGPDARVVRDLWRMSCGCILFFSGGKQCATMEPNLVYQVGNLRNPGFRGVGPRRPQAARVPPGRIRS
jgi:hypothetical protein